MSTIAVRTDFFLYDFMPLYLELVHTMYILCTYKKVSTGRSTFDSSAILPLVHFSKKQL